MLLLLDLSKSPIAGLHVNELVSTEGTTAQLSAQAGGETEGEGGIVLRKSVLRVVGYGVALWFSSPCERKKKHPLHAACRQ